MSGIVLNSLPDVWYHNLEKFPNKVAVVCDGRALTYAECDLITDRLRTQLQGRFGFKPGDTVLVAAPSCIEYVLVYWAVAKGGGGLAPVNTRLGADELAHVVVGSRASIAVVHSACRHALLPAMQVSSVQHIIGIGPDPVSPDAVAFESLVAHGGHCDSRPDVGENDLALIMHTSGTTGRSKGAMMRHGDIMFNNRLTIYAHGLCHEDVHLLVVPMFHATALYSLVPTAALQGSTLVIASRTGARHLISLIARHAVTTFFGVPMMFRLLVAVEGIDPEQLASLRLLAYAGAPMDETTIRRLHELVPNASLHNFYGLTETISLTHVLPGCEALRRPGSIGKLLPHVRHRIVNENGSPVAPGRVGRLMLHRDNVVQGYWQEPGRLEESISGEWFDSGDLASVDAEGFVYLQGRSKDVIIVGGENVYAAEVESCIMDLPDVADVAIVGAEATGVRAHLGELVQAVVVVRPGGRLTDRDIKRHCAERLATYKVPHIVTFASRLARNAAGKLLKRELRD